MAEMWSAVSNSQSEGEVGTFAGSAHALHAGTAGVLGMNAQRSRSLPISE